MRRRPFLYRRAGWRNGFHPISLKMCIFLHIVESVGEHRGQKLYNTVRMGDPETSQEELSPEKRSQPVLGHLETKFARRNLEKLIDDIRSGKLPLFINEQMD